MPDEKNKSQTRPKVVIEDIAEQDTMVICPICKTGLVPPSVASKINELLECSHDGPTHQVKKK